MATRPRKTAATRPAAAPEPSAPSPVDVSQIVIDAEPRALIGVDLVGKHYEVTMPKSSLALKLAVRAKTAGDDPTLLLATIDEWLVKAFGAEMAKGVQDRMDDADDALDIPHIMRLMEALVAAGAAPNPPT